MMTTSQSSEAFFLTSLLFALWVALSLSPTRRRPRLLDSLERARQRIAVTKGELSHDRTIPADIDKWVPVGYNPKKAVFFYDKRTGEEVIAGDESISYGNTVYVKNPVYPEGDKTRFASDREEAFKVTKGYKRGKYMAEDYSSQVYV